MFVERRLRALGCRMAVGLFLLVAGGGAATALAAATPRAYEVDNVAVDVTAKTAAAARDAAIAEGHQKAFRRLLERLTLRADRDRLPKLTTNQIATTYLKDFSVAEEKSSSTRYLAKLDFRFNRDAVRRLLMDAKLPFAETYSKPVLVLPVYDEAGALVLWDTPNPWRAAWDALPPSDGLVPLVLPLGDLTDIATIGAEQAAQGDTQRLAAIASRYGAGDSLVARANEQIDPRDGSVRLNVTTTRYGPALNGQTLVHTYAAAAGETTESLFKRAAADIAAQVEDDWKRDNLLQLGNPAVLAVTIPIATLQDWLSVRNRLSGVAVVRRSDVVMLSRTEVQVNLHYVGSTDQLVLALAQADLTLTQEESGWVLRSQHGAPAQKGS